MEIINKPIKQLKAYENNPRINKDSVKYVAQSIKEFGFKVPVIIDKDDVIVCGHTRVLACKRLGIKEIPCIVVDDLSEEQIRAFRLADNRVGEFSIWESDKLLEELDKIDLNMADLGFDFKIDEELANIKVGKEEEKVNDRVKTDLAVNLQLFDKTDCEGKYDIPKIYAENFIPKKLISFNYCKSTQDFNCGVHFFIDDYQFERLWNSPAQYVDLLTQFECVFTPDFSLYSDMPIAMQIWNTYRSRLLGQYWQRQGIVVIPTISWSDERSFDFCFDGIEKGSIVAISTTGSFRSEETKKLFYDGFNKMIEKIDPKKIIVYGNNKINYNLDRIIYFKNEILERIKND